ncbi:MAG: tRNA (adenosine(37)-N6)-dimethylallyltransferase MiaA [Chloroflexia bacterium]|nr:tRNA (adenosine(37)-N6)-dimethylallyltransferase MiaA [Chloroflexia bacterium]
MPLNHPRSPLVRPPLVAILGPTASGKTALSLRLARTFPIEIVNADSRSFYRGMDIGTAKVSRADREAVPHHLIDILDPGEPMSLATFQDLAMELIARIHGRGYAPLLAGGTAQYVNAVIEGWTIPRVPPNEPFRQQLERDAATDGVESVAERLRRVDPESADRSGRNLRRIIRALEIHAATGEPMSVLRGKRPVPFDPLQIELWLPRDMLHERIARRTRQMMRDGLVEEVRSLLAGGVPATAPAFSAIGYRQVLPLIDGRATEAEVISQIETDSHRLIRHQQTWFRKNSRLIRIDASVDGWEDRVEHLVRSHCATWLTSDHALGM